MLTAILPYKSSFFEYIRFGSGPQVAVCFHGYGEKAESFAFLEKHLGNTYTFIAINLPWHQKSSWNEHTAFTVDELWKVLQSIFVHCSLQVQKFAVIGYSMGGRIALSLADAYPAAIARICLLAPDGLTVNFWYRLATQTAVGNRLFRYTMYHPGWFMRMLAIGNRLRLINQSIYKFTHHYIDDAQVREELYNRWTCMRKFGPHLKALQQKIRKHQFPVRMLFGKYDRIITTKNAAAFAAPVHEHCRITVLDSGHQLLHEKYAGAIMEALLS